MSSPSLSIPLAPAPFTFDWGEVRMRSSFVPPLLGSGLPGDPWVHAARSEERYELAGDRGSLVRDSFTARGLGLDRLVFLPDGGDGLAVRLELRNLGALPIRLEELRPLECDGPGSVVISGADAGDWEMIRQGRQKNDIPTSLRLRDFDDDYAQATAGATEVGRLEAGGGHPIEVESDCFCLLRCRSPAGVCLLVGFLSQRDHLARIVLSTDRSREHLVRLSAVCELDDCELAPGNARACQWVVTTVGTDANGLISSFAERVARYHGGTARAPKPSLRPARRAPTVYCSWYYYGPRFSEADLDENLAELARDPMPFDVLLIDSCWELAWGDWEANERWPGGMKAAAGRIRSSGHEPGIWTCPFLADPKSALAASHPDWLLLREDGSPVIFPMGIDSCVLDPTVPEVEGFVEELYRKLTRDWGFHYHKLDFTRAVFVDPRARVRDRSATRLEAYERGMRAVRRGIGPTAYLSVCGGHYGGSLGLADSQRSGSDVRSSWNDPPAVPKVKQNLLRTWMSRLWDVDPDAMMVRRRSFPAREGDYGLSLGNLTDTEARTMALNQYLGGGMVCFTERLHELDADRRALYRHIIPSVGCPSRPIDLFTPRCPSVLVTRVEPRCAALAPWLTVAVVNWGDLPIDRALTLSGDVLGDLPGDRFLVTEFFAQRALGVAGRGDRLDLRGIEPHGSRLLRIAPWSGEAAILAMTDLHFSGGGVEIVEWRSTRDRAAGILRTHWRYPVAVTAAFPLGGERFRLVSTVLAPAREDFAIAGTT